jgi:nitrile hydratase subunit beta
VNRVHDLGGVPGFGNVEPEANESVFHHDWERRVFALALASSFWRRWSIDASRHARENVADYLPKTYYERWFAGLSAMIDKVGLARTAPTGPPLQAKDVSVGGPRKSPDRTPDRPARFMPGDVVRTRIIDGPGHTRLPRYAQARTGVIAAYRGGHLLPDDSAAGLPPNVQALYSVRFEAGELWGPAARSTDSVYLDLWDSYLEPA